MNRLGNDDRKLDPVPEWEKSDSFEGWRRRVKRWADNNAKPERKAEMLLASLKKNNEKIGLKEFVKAEFEENSRFDFYDRKSHREDVGRY